MVYPAVKSKVRVRALSGTGFAMTVNVNVVAARV